MDGLKIKAEKLTDLWFDYLMDPIKKGNISLLYEISNLYSDISFNCLGEIDIKEMVNDSHKIKEEIDQRGWDLLKHEVKMFLEIPQIKRGVQMWWYYRHLDYGSDVDLGGGDYAIEENARDKDRAYKILITMYDDLAVYEEEVQLLVLRLSKFDTFLHTDDAVRDIIVLDGIFKTYHNEVEYIRDLILENKKNQHPPKILPKELDTDEARRWLSKTIEKGFMVDGYQWAQETTRYQIAYWVEVACDKDKLGIKNKWKWAQDIWGLKGLAQTRKESIDRFGKVEREKDIDDCFK